MLTTIFNVGQPSKLEYLCAIGESRDPIDALSGKTEQPLVTDTTRWWATGILIQERAILTAAHAPLSSTILGDRAYFPPIPPVAPQPSKLGRQKPLHLPARTFVIQRSHAHPQAPQAGFDLRLHILLPNQPHACELQKRACRLLTFNDKTMSKFGIDGFGGMRDTYGQTDPHPANSRSADPAPGANDGCAHGHDPAREFVIRPDPLPPSTPLPDASAHLATAAFGDSGAPVWWQEPPNRFPVVGIYVRRSINRPAMTNPDLVFVKWTGNLRVWVESVLDRYNLHLP